MGVQSDLQDTIVVHLKMFRFLSFVHLIHVSYFAYLLQHDIRSAHDRCSHMLHIMSMHLTNNDCWVLASPMICILARYIVVHLKMFRFLFFMHLISVSYFAYLLRMTYAAHMIYVRIRCILCQCTRLITIAGCQLHQ